MRIPIVKEGVQIAIPLILLSGIGFMLNIYLGIFLLGLSFSLTAFFRDPKRETKTSAKQFVSPADGRVVAIEEVYENRYLERRVKKIDIFLSIFNVHITYAPITGKILFVDYYKGKFKPAFLKKSSVENEHNIIGIENDNFKILVKQIAGLIARRIVCYPKKDNLINTGQKMGLIKFGSRVEIFLPLDSKIKVKLGDKVKGAVTVLGEN